MNGTNLKNLKKQLKERGIRPLKKLGQNFLINEKAADKFIEALQLSKEDVVVEAGSGTGFLTEKLSQRAKTVIAIEKDEKMVEISKENLKNLKNIKFIKGDILKESDKEISGVSSYKLCGNIPYYITSALIRKFLECEKKPESMVLIIQKELAQRITASPPKMSMLAVSVQFYSKPKTITYVSKKNFWPSPKVDSAILRITPLINAGKKPINADLFFKIVKAGFSHPRKKILNNLSKVLKLNKEETKLQLIKNSIDPGRRAETLNIEEWKRLTKSFKNYLLF